MGVRAAAMSEGERFMETALQTFVLIVQLALAGFLVWGGWLSLKEALGVGARAEQMVSEATPSAEPRGFERVASLVLLALLCSTLAAIA